MLIVSERQRYLAYMLRLWQVDEDQPAWRASLENAHSGAHQGFANLDALFAFLEGETGQKLPAAGESSPGSREAREQESESYSGS